MPRPSSRPRGRRRRLASLAVTGSSLLAIGGCGGASGSSVGHDSPEAAARGFFNALGAFDGTPGGLQSILDWVPPSRRQGSSQDFSTLVGGATRVHFQLDNLQVGSASTSGDGATVSVRGTLRICASGTVGTQTFDSCQPAPITPGGTFDQVSCVREQGQWYVADYGSVGGGTTSGAPPSVTPSTPDPAVTAPPPASATSTARATT